METYNREMNFMDENFTEKMKKFLDNTFPDITNDPKVIDSLKASYTSAMLQIMSLANTSMSMYLLCKQVFNNDAEKTANFMKETLEQVHARASQEVLDSLKEQLGKFSTDPLFTEEMGQLNTKAKDVMDSSYNDIVKSVFSIFNSLCKAFSKEPSKE